MRLLLISLAVLFLAAPFFANAQSSSGSSSTKSSGPKPVMSAEGFRMGIIHMKSNSSAKTPVSDGSGEVRTDSTIDYSGITMGYSYIPVNQVGCIVNVSYLTDDNPNEFSYSLTRFDASLTSGFNTRFSGKIGINGSVQSFKNRLEGSTPLPGAGLSVGFGFQLNKALGLDLTYMSMNQNIQVDSNKALATYKHQGLEVTLHATF